MKNNKEICLQEFLSILLFFLIIISIVYYFKNNNNNNQPTNAITIIVISNALLTLLIGRASRKINLQLIEKKNRRKSPAKRYKNKREKKKLWHQRKKMEKVYLVNERDCFCFCLFHKCKKAK